MIKYSLVLLNLFGFLSFQFFFDDGVLVEDNLPASIAAGETVRVDVNVNKAEISGFAKLEIILPPGLTATSVETSGASFTFSSQKAKFIWMSLPEDPEFTVSYDLTADPTLNGNLIVKGTFSYIKGNQRVDYDLKSKLIAVGIAAEPVAQKTETETATEAEQTPEEETSDVASVDNTPGNTEMTCERIITGVSPSEYMVELRVLNSDAQGFVKVTDEVPNGYSVMEDDSDGAIFTRENDGRRAKFVWFEAPDLDEFGVSYRIKSEMGGGMPEITGTFSYILGETAHEVSVNQGSSEEYDVTMDTSDPVAEAITPDKSEETPMEVDNRNEIVEETTEEAAETIVNTGTQVDTPTMPTNTGEDTAQQVEETVEEVVDEVAEEMVEEVEEVAEEVVTPPARTVAEETTTADSEAEEEPVVADRRATSIPDPETGITYKVQIVAGHNTVGRSYFKSRHGFSESFDIEQHEGWVKYTTGSHDEYKQARDSRERLNRSYNFSGPFVTAYNDGVRITVQEALMISNQNWYK